MKEKIIQLRKEGKTYDQIKCILNCSKGTIAYYCGEGQKEKSLKRQSENRAKNKKYQKKYSQHKRKGKPQIQLSIELDYDSLKKEPSGKRKKHVKWYEEDIKLVFDLFEKKKTYLEISKITKKSIDTVRKFLNKHGYFSNEGKELLYIICPACGNKMRKYKTENGKVILHRKYCNFECFIKHKKRNLIKCICLNCKTELFSNKKWNRKYCNNKCRMEFVEKGKIQRMLSEEILPFSATIIKKYLIKIYGEKCMKCGWNQRHSQTGKVPIELNHKDGNSDNHHKDNVELICPNCHSLTPNYRALNKGKGRYKRRQRAREGKSF